MPPTNRIIGVIPARYGSSRFEGKVLSPIMGKPMIQWVYERSRESTLLDALYVAVDDERVKRCVEGFGGVAMMTGLQHRSGTDRIAEAVRNMPCDIVVNIQGDQPLIDARMIDEIVQPLIDDPAIPMSSAKTRIEPDEYHDPGVVKVVTDAQGFMLYSSRSLIPYPHTGKTPTVYEHIGIYAYRKDFLLQFASWPPGELEQIESLEQLRVIEKGYKLLVVETQCERYTGVSVDTPADLKKVEGIIERSKLKRL